METATRYVHDGREPVRTSTYAKGVAQLREAGQERPFTFRENIMARVEAYERGDKTLFNTWLDSCTGIVTKSESTLFQLVSPSPELIHTPSGFNDSFLPIDYDAVQGIVLDSSKGKYNQLLENRDILIHGGWLAAVEKDKALLKVYRDIMFKGFKRDKAMGFYVRQNTEEDELRALFVHDLNNYSNANGDGNLIYDGSFLRGSPVVVSAAGAREKKPGSAYRNQAMTEEERLDERVRAILSPYEQLKCSGTVKLYDNITENAVRELKGLYKQK